MHERSDDIMVRHLEIYYRVLKGFRDNEFCLNGVEKAIKSVPDPTNFMIKRVKDFREGISNHISFLAYILYYVKQPLPEYMCLTDRRFQLLITPNKDHAVSVEHIRRLGENHGFSFVPASPDDPLRLNLSLISAK